MVGYSVIVAPTIQCHCHLQQNLLEYVIPVMTSCLQDIKLPKDCLMLGLFSLSPIVVDFLLSGKADFLQRFDFMIATNMI